ncbi:MAG: thiol reductant ABC exporter subunit CydC [Chloroflexi bacterium]|nr:thiol reductant ABC exporter subunit CydC [Chloroflexota bacterium]
MTATTVTTAPDSTTAQEQQKAERQDVNRRLFALTKGVRWRIALAAGLGLVATVTGVARLSMQGSAVAMVFEGAPLVEVLLVLLWVLALPLARVVLTMAKEFTSHHTAAIMKVRLRHLLYAHLLELGPSYLHKRRTGEVLLNTVDAVEQLETYYGRYLPQLAIAAVAPIGIFVFMAVLDLPSALIFLTFALLTLFAPTFFRRATVTASRGRRGAYSALAAEFVDAVQGLPTLKVFGQSEARGEMLATKARHLYRTTMKVLAVNIAAGGVANLCMTLGAAVTLAWGAVRVSQGELELRPLMIVLFLGVEVFRPLRELNQLYHQGLLAMSSAMGMFSLLDDRPDVADPVTSSRLSVASGQRNATDAVTDYRLLTTDYPLEPTIHFEHVSFAYESGKRPALEDVSFELPAGTTLGLVGPSGAGKSTVVNLLFRFYDPQQGRILLGGHDLREIPLEMLRRQIAVVAQDTYLFYGTVSDNLRLGKPDATQEELEAAAGAANAHEFILNLKDGYETIIGERGQKLSGGQRQRIAIARAILKDAPILVLDEATSHVDSENEAVIQEALERLMQNRTTLIIAHRLSTIVGADQIVVLERGRRVESGRHTELMARNGVYARLVAIQARAAEEAEAAKADIAAMAAFDGAAQENATVVCSTSARHQASASPRLNGSGDTTVRGTTPGDAQLLGRASHAKPVEPVPLSAWATGVRLLGLVRPQWVQLSITLAGGLIKAGAGIALGVASAALASRVAVAAGLADEFSPYGVLIPTVIGLAVAVAVFTWFESWIAHDMAYKLLGEMRVSMYQKLDPLAPSYLLGRRSGDLASIITSDIETVESFFAHAIAPLFVAVLVPGVALTALAFLSWPLALALVPFLIAVGLSPHYIGRHTERLGNNLRRQLGEVNAHVTDSVQGLREVVAFSQGRLRLQEIVRNSEALTALQLRYGRQLGFQSGTIEGIQAFGGLAVLTLGAYLVTQGHLTAGQLPIATMLAFTSFSPVAEIARVAKELANAFGSGRRVFVVHDEPVAVRDGHDVPPGTPVSPSLEFEHVSFNYGPGEPQALIDVSFRAEAGQTVALVGRSGAGKTTAAHLMMRFWDPQQGRVLLGGHDVRGFELNDLRTRFSLVSQDIYLFNMSIRENLRLANPDATDEEVEEAANKACAHEFILGLPDGYETIAGERGVALSGGQRQRLAIARALLKRAPVLILDEATSHLDTENERAVRQAIAELMEGSTTFVIAHRLSTVRDADRIVVLDAGWVAEQGTHEELLARDGTYAQLIRSQLALPRDEAAAQPNGTAPAIGHQAVVAGSRATLP